MIRQIFTLIRLIFILEAMKTHPTKTWVLIIILSLIVAVTNSISFFISIFIKPPNSVYLGTVHYWEDYFFYLNHFFQGAHGAYLTANRFTSEITQPTIFYWVNILMGKIGNIIGLNPVLSYNIFLLILIFGLLLIIYYISLKHFEGNSALALGAYLFAVFATSLQNRVRSGSGEMIFWPYQIWKTPHFAFDRLGGAPHQVIQSILFLVLIFSVFWDLPKNGRITKYIIPALSVVFLSTINPVLVLSFIICIWPCVLIFWITHKKKSLTYFLKALIVTIFGGLVSLYMSTLINIQPHIQTKIWEAANHSYTTWSFLLRSIGPVIIFAFIGFVSRIRKMTFIEIFGGVFLTFCYIMFMFIDLPKKLGVANLRFLFPAGYIFWGIFAARGADYLSIIASQKLKISGRFIYTILISIFLLISGATIIWEVNLKIPKKEDLTSPLFFLNREVYAGMEKLSQLSNYDEITLGNPSTHIDTLIPPLSGHTSFSGHLLHTINNAQKQESVSSIFTLSQNPEAVLKFLADNHITYVVFTLYDGDRNRFSNYYQFLNPVFENEGMSVYKINKS